MPITATLIGVVVSCLVTWVYWKWSQVKKYWLERDVPYLSPHPILGNLTFLLKINTMTAQSSRTAHLAHEPMGHISMPNENVKRLTMTLKAVSDLVKFNTIRNKAVFIYCHRETGIWMRQIYSNYKKPYVGIWFFWRPALVVNSPDIARNILIKDSAVFRNRFATAGNKDPIGNMGLFSIKDPMWSVLRRHLNSTFSAAKLRLLDGYVRSKAKELEQRINNDLHKRLDLKELFVDYTTDIIGTTAFGISGNATLTGKDPMRSITKEFSKFDVFRGLSWICIFFLPEVVDIFRFKVFPTSTTEFFRKIIRRVVADREKNSDKWGENKDLLDALIKLRKEDEKFNSEDFLISQSTILLIGGFDTTGSVLTFLTYELAYYPEIQEKLNQELVEAKQNHGNDTFDSTVLSELKYLNCIIKEALRKYSPMAWFDRVAACDYKIDDKLTIKAGTPVYINAIGMHYDPEFFPDPEKFDPDRFLPENEAKIKPYTYMPFGEGPRTCIGYRFAMMTIRFALASTFLSYKIEPYSDAPSPAEVKIDNLGIFYMPGEPMHVKFVKRSKL